jgi:hypothetical protein
VKIVNFVFRDEDEAKLQGLADRLGWSCVRVVRELLARARVAQEPSLDAVSLLVMSAEMDEIHVG